MKLDKAQKKQILGSYYQFLLAEPLINTLCEDLVDTGNDDLVLKLEKLLHDFADAEYEIKERVDKIVAG